DLRPVRLAAVVGRDAHGDPARPGHGRLRERFGGEGRTRFCFHCYNLCQSPRGVKGWAGGVQ
ncbi:MAG: hypothetical protein M0022_00730, partial [Desulfobacteraceae bacterium]|nr:hypothetical protein [Desulfobacteraceae bacterium]